MTNDLRNTFFYGGPSIFKDWPEGVKLGIGFNLEDARYREKNTYTATIDGITYSIPRDKAVFWGRKFDLGRGKMPNIIPINQFEVRGKTNEINPYKPTKPQTARLW